jgi:hypothetical protein
MRIYSNSSSAVVLPYFGRKMEKHMREGTKMETEDGQDGVLIDSVYGGAKRNRYCGSVL